MYTAKIIFDNGGSITRRRFVEEMAGFIGTYAQKDGRENRTPYNKSKLPRYFGFVDIKTDAEKNNHLTLTRRGTKLIEYIGTRENEKPEQTYYILPEHRDAFIDLIFESVIFDSFGKNNCGAETSNTDVEPPKVVFKTIMTLGKATAEEICYVMYALNRGVFDTFDDAVADVQARRAVSDYDYSAIMEDWELSNIVNDCKIINIFTDDSIQLLRCEKNEDIGKVFYYLNPSLGERRLAQIRSIDAIYTPLHLFVYKNADTATLENWINSTVLGGVSDNSFVFQYSGEGESFLGDSSTGRFVPGVFEKALLKAYKNEKKNVFLVVKSQSEAEFFGLFGEYAPLLHRIKDLKHNRNGCSVSALNSPELYTYLVANSAAARAILGENQISLPSNLQIIGEINMTDNLDNTVFDYEFSRCLVSDTADDNNAAEEAADETSRIAGGTNILLYGVPGSGKSWIIEHEYCKPGTRAERLIFHPDYTNADFVGQILPVVDPVDRQVTYEFTPGPFTDILREAHLNPQKKYVLVIEEINRGNAPAIFGDVFQLLDRMVEPKTIDGITYPVGTSEYGITNKNVAVAVYGDGAHKVRIPSNLSIIGTMNTSDQNVFTLDTAFQRRWRMRLVENTFNNVRDSLAKAKILDTEVTWELFCTTINSQIIGNKAKMASAEDKRLGVYFIHENDIAFDARAVPGEGYATLWEEYDALVKKEMLLQTTPEEGRRLGEIRDAVIHNRIFPEKVIKYLWDDAFKFNPEAIFDTDSMESLEQVIRTFVYNKGDERYKIFNQRIRGLLRVSQP